MPRPPRGRRDEAARPRVVVAGLGDSGLLTAIHLAEARRRRRHLGQAGAGQRPGARHPARPARRLGPRLLHPVRPLPPARRRTHRARVAHRRRPRRRARSPSGWPTGPRSTSRTTSSSSRPASPTASGAGPTCSPRTRSTPPCRRRTRDSPAAGSITVVGGGAAAVSTAANLASTWPDKQVAPLLPRRATAPASTTRGSGRRSSAASRDRGVALHPGHRAVVPDGFACDRITDEPVEWSTGQPAAAADATVWAIGRVRPNTAWLPPELLDDGRLRPRLARPRRARPRPGSSRSATSPPPTRCARRPATAPTGCWPRTSAPTWPASRLADYRAPRGRWGSVLGVQAERPGGLRPQRQGVPVPGLVDPDRAPAVDRAARHLRRGQAGRLTS